MRIACRAAMTVAVVACLQGCTMFDPLDQRGETINRNATDYANNAELLNVVRASLSEPLTFLTITGVSGTASAGIGLGLPSIPIGPHGTDPRDYVFGSNSLSRQNSNTFNASVVDDPASFAALLAPINPALIAFFEHQGYSREELFFLFVDEIREVKRDPSGKITAVVRDYKAADPTDSSGDLFIAQLATLIDNGLTAQIDISTTPTGRSLPPSKFCMDPLLGRSTFGVEKRQPGGPIRIGETPIGVAPAAATTPPPNSQSADLPIVSIEPAQLDAGACDSDPWLSSKAGDGADSKAAPAGADKAVTDPQLLASSDNTLWLKLKDGELIHFDRIKGVWKKSDPIELGKKPDKDDTPPTTSQPMVGYPLDVTYHDPKRILVQYQLSLRSTYGAYNYLGAILHQRLPHLDDPKFQGNNALDVRPFASDEMSYTGLLNLETRTASVMGRAGDCFANVEYRGVAYCVPQNATRTKRLFTLLHQLQQLNTAPSNTPATLTLTAVH